MNKKSKSPPGLRAVSYTYILKKLNRFLIIQVVVYLSITYLNYSKLDARLLRILLILAIFTSKRS